MPRIHLCFVLILCGLTSAPSWAEYPVTRKVPTIIQKHGVRISDPYSWMENLHDPELLDWVAEQNEYTDRYISSRLGANLAAEFEGIFKDTQNILDEVLDRELTHPENNLPLNDIRTLEFNEQLRRGILTNQPSSRSGTYTIQMNSDSGSDLKVMQIYDNSKKLFLPDLLWVKFAYTFWAEDEKSFIYFSDTDGRLGQTRPTIRRHILGTAQEDDVIIYEAPAADVWLSLIGVEGSWLLFSNQQEHTEAGLLNLETGAYNKLWDVESNAFSPFHFRDGEMFEVNYESADKGEIVARKVSTGKTRVLVPESDRVLEQALYLNDTFFISSIEDASVKLSAIDAATLATTPIDLPGIGSIALNVVMNELLVSYMSYTELPSVWQLDFGNKKLGLVKSAPTSPIALRATRVHYKAHNGQMAPIWLVHREDVILDSSTPVYLYGYGGFTVNLLPRFALSYVPFYERGGVAAFVTLPGGFELGKAWRNAGKHLHKKNVFDDFAAAARRLIALGFTNPDKLAMGGGSNGGLLVGATMNLYPELFRVAVPEFGVMDLVNFQNFTGGKWWKEDYGDTFIKLDFLNQFRLSPFHNLKRRRYPATLVTTGNFDDRVVPSHSYRYAARLQERQIPDRPALLHTVMGASHGSGSNAKEALRYITNKWTFILSELGVTR